MCALPCTPGQTLLFLVLGPYLVMLMGYFILHTQESLLTGSKEPCGILGIEPGSDTCKAALSLWPQG